jgi:hypothetical protein
MAPSNIDRCGAAALEPTYPARLGRWRDYPFIARFGLSHTAFQTL